MDAVGPTFLETAFASTRGLTGLDGWRVGNLRARVATGLDPQSEPWSWVTLAPATPDLDPLTEMRVALADLRAEVDALKEAARGR
ncbi:MAG: hypothetical protein L0H25_10125 [Micrococcales bacterium]|nr:hypothetical protein [Micrococcales bacterium]